VGCWDSFRNLGHLPLLYLSFGGATNLQSYLNDLLFRHIEVPTMPNNWLGWYAEATFGKVKCLICEVVFARKSTRMLSHLGYEGPYSICDKGVSLCQRATAKIRRLFNECSGVAPMYLGEVGVDLSDSSGTYKVGGLHALWQSTLQSLDPSSSGGSVQVEIQGSQRNPGGGSQSRHSKCYGTCYCNRQSRTTTETCGAIRSC
jgi:hypothetical protein